jgi:hypothetical protein
MEVPDEVVKYVMRSLVVCNVGKVIYCDNCNTPKVEPKTNDVGKCNECQREICCNCGGIVTCKRCDKMLCRDCMGESEGRRYCFTCDIEYLYRKSRERRERRQSKHQIRTTLKYQIRTTLK